MKYIKEIIATLVGVLLVGSVVFGSTISHVETTDTVNTLRTTVNTVIDSIQNTTSSVGNLASLASTTGNLIVGSSTQWRAMIVGTNGSVLTASSTAVGGLSWETLGARITSLNGSTSSTQTFAVSSPVTVSTANGVHTFGLSINAVSSTRAISAGPGLLGGGDLSADRTIYWNPTQATSTITEATTTNLHFTSATGTSVGFVDGTKQTTAYKTKNAVINNTTSTTSSSMQFGPGLFIGAYTLTRLECSTNGATVTISAFTRSSSTPTTNDTTTIANVVCTSTGFATTTFTNANFGPFQRLEFASSSVANSTTTLTFTLQYKEQ